MDKHIDLNILKEKLPKSVQNDILGRTLYPKKNNKPKHKTVYSVDCRFT